MPRTHLRETLEQLHQELESTDRVDSQARELLEEVLSGIQDVLHREEGPSGEEHSSLVDRLTEATQRFEKEHPSLTAAVNRVATALSNLGI